MSYVTQSESAEQAASASSTSTMAPRELETRPPESPSTRVTSTGEFNPAAAHPPPEPGETVPLPSGCCHAPTICPGAATEVRVQVSRCEAPAVLGPGAKGAAQGELPAPIEYSGLVQSAVTAPLISVEKVVQTPPQGHVSEAPACPI